MTVICFISLAAVYFLATDVGSFGFYCHFFPSFYFLLRVASSWDGNKVASEVYYGSSIKKKRNRIE